MLDAFTHTHLYASVQHASQPAFDIASIAWGDSGGDGQPTVNNERNIVAAAVIVAVVVVVVVPTSHTQQHSTALRSHIAQQTYHSLSPVCTFFLHQSRYVPREAKLRHYAITRVSLAACKPVNIHTTVRAMQSATKFQYASLYTLRSALSLSVETKAIQTYTEHIPKR